MADSSEMARGSELAFVGVGATLSLLTVIGIIRAVQPGQFFAWLQSIHDSARRALRQRSGGADDEVGLIVKERMTEMKLRGMRRAGRVLALCMSIMTCLMILRIRSGTAGRTSIPMDIFQMTVHALLAGVAVFPESSVTWRTIDVWYVIAILVNTVWVSPLSIDTEERYPRLVMSDLVVFYLNSERQDWRVVAPLNLTYGISSSVTILMHFQSTSFLVVAQLLLVGFFAMSAHSVEVGIATALRQSLEAEAASELLQAASALLRSCNDVIVELDSDGVIVGQVKDLASFLLRSPGSLLSRVRLSDLMAEEDRQRFLSTLEAGPLRGKSEVNRTDGRSLATAVHVHMRDGNNSLLKVEAFSFGYRRVDGQTRYMTGLRDYSDLPPARGSAPDKAALPAAHNQPPSVASSQWEGSQSSSEDESPAAAVRVGAPLHDISEGIGMKAVLIIDATIDGMPVVCVSGGFQLHIGRVRPGACFLDMVHPAEEFCNWLRMASRYGANWPACRVTIGMRQGDFRASCTVFHEGPEGESPDRKHLHLLFDRIKRPKRLTDDDGRGGPARPHTNFKGTPANHGTPENHASL